MKRKIAGLCLTSALCLSLAVPAFAAMPTNGTDPMLEAAVHSGTEDFGEIVIDGEVGDKIFVGDLVFEIVSDEEMNEILETPVTRASTGRFNIALSGNDLSQDFEVTANYPWAKVWVGNKGTEDIKFTITKGSKTGYVVKGSEVTLKAGKNTTVYATKAWDPDTYYANFTCGKGNMSGSASCRVASTQHELDI